MMLIRGGFFWFVCVCAAWAQAPRAATPVPSAAEAADADIKLMELVGESPLSDAEKRQVLDVATKGLQTDPKSWTEGYANARKSLQWFDGTRYYAAGKINMYPQANDRMYWRRTFALQPQPNLETQIMEKHDPTIAVIVGKGNVPTDVVTESSLRSLLKAVTWADASVGLPPPPADFIARERRSLQANWSSFTPELQTAYAHIERNYAAAYMYMLFMSAGQKNFIRTSIATKAPAGAGSGASTALMFLRVYDSLVKNGHHVGVSEQEEIMYMHLTTNEAYKTHKDTEETLFGKP